MKYYLITIKQDSQSINAYNTQNAALAAFHTEMAYAYNSGIETTCIVTDKYGSQNKVGRFEVHAESEDNDASE